MAGREEGVVARDVDVLGFCVESRKNAIQAFLVRIDRRSRLLGIEFGTKGWKCERLVRGSNASNKDGKVKLHPDGEIRE